MKEFKTEYEILYRTLCSAYTEPKVKEILSKIKDVAVENKLDFATGSLKDFFRLTVLSFDAREDKYYGKD